MSRKNQYIVTTTYKTGEMSTKQKYIGVDLSNDLGWSHHINAMTGITTRANKTPGLLL